ncbi:hypothetical protein [Salsipaludibacter albus]|uniref:hypothetical protein n=1 Tax=Salsipaludibacter albus TaxID=2849650 RepID=UPI001EE4C3EF|nr:hypothetical protein [Salsipaludibacter albus]MBY5161919.1 hypothetical protein [Salsipaludibacter albus]
MTDTTARRAAIAIGLGATLLLAWGIGALGVIGASGDPADLMYLPVFAVAVVGTAVARLRSREMVTVLLAMAAWPVAVTVVALAAGLAPGNPRLEIIGLNGMFATMFAASAWLFHVAAGGTWSLLQHRDA